jgi:uroporphyrinogen decarboxylase
MWLEYPVKNRDDWEKIKETRLNHASINNRYSTDFKDFLDKAKDRTFPLGIFYYPIGFFGSLRFLIGEDRLYTMYYDNPGLIKDILHHLCDLWIQMGEELLSKVKIDIAVFWEDMSSKNGPLISPGTFREFMSPNYTRLVDFFRSKGIKNFMVDTDGNVEVIIPLFLETGVNGMFPFEQQAGNDLIEIRKKYPELIMAGGFDKNTLFKNKEDIDKELEKMEYLIKQGGYIPFADHLVPPNSSWENYKYFRERLGSIVENTRVL